jgi:hypothetical protein
MKIFNNNFTITFPTRFEAERKRLSGEYNQLIGGLGKITTANGTKMKKLKIQSGSGSSMKILRLSKIVKLLKSAKSKNSFNISFQRQFLADQNKLINSMIERIKVGKCLKK